VSIWVVPSAQITASSPDDRESMFDPAIDKTFRYPADYDLPDDVAHM
jgi:ring-1,2-phenylacetyl-CoA epoxidase subunit PaaB